MFVRRRRSAPTAAAAAASAAPVVTPQPRSVHNCYKNNVTNTYIYNHTMNSNGAKVISYVTVMTNTVCTTW